MADESNPELLQLTAQIVSAHAGQDQLPAAALPELIQSVYRSLVAAGTTEPAAAPPTPAVPIRKSVFRDHIVCLEDGRKLATLKRHLQTSHGMTPDQYRQRWDLPASYPMVAPDYASRRANLAKRVGLGRLPAGAEPTHPAEAGEAPPPREPAVTRVPARRARVQGLSARQAFRAQRPARRGPSRRFELSGCPKVLTSALALMSVHRPA